MFTGFETKVREKLIEFVERHHAPRSGRKVAVFDADGTLWRGDAGEAFFRYQVENGWVPHAPKRKPWETYLKECLEGDPEKAFGWLAQWNKEVSETEMLRWSEEFFEKQWMSNLFEPMRELCHTLLNAGFELWVVSGSIRWVVEVGARGFGIRQDRVIGTAVTVDDGRLTDKIVHPIPYRLRKAKLIASIIGEKPLLAVGNTSWDKEMLATAAELALAINSENKGEPNYQAEQRLKRLAETNGWLIQRF